MPDLHGLLPDVHPKRPGPSPHAERLHHGGLSRGHKVISREERRQPVRASLVLAHHGGLVVEKQRAPFLTYPHSRMDRAPMHLVQPPEPVGVPIVIEVPSRLHPLMPRPDVPLHRLQWQHEPQGPRYSLMHSGTQYSRCMSAMPMVIRTSVIRLFTDKSIRPRHNPA